MFFFLPGRHNAKGILDRAPWTWRWCLVGGCVLKTAWQEHYQRLYLDLPLVDMIPACVLLLASAMPEAAWWVALSKLFVALRLPGRKENLSCFKHVSQRNINVGTDWECSCQADLRTHLSTKHHHLNTRAVQSLCTLTRGVFENMTLLDLSHD